MKVIILTVIVSLFTVTGCSGCAEKDTNSQTASDSGSDGTAPADSGESVTTQKQETEAGLVIEDIKEGAGAEATNGSRVSVHYTGTLTDGKKFDSSHDRGTPLQFELGAGQVIKGWDQGVLGMKVGGKRKLTIPSDLAYGDRGIANVIPPGATLIFEVELMDVNSAD